MTLIRRFRMARLPALVALALLVACGKAPGPESTWTRIDGPTFTAELAAGRPADAPPMVIVDVREPELFAEGHIPGAINMPWPDAKTRAPVELDLAHDIVLVCHGGPMGDELAQILDERGFTKVRNLAGGMNRWNGPVEPVR
jgi:rhodanese-related sulfurtransferase